MKGKSILAVLLVMIMVVSMSSFVLGATSTDMSVKAIKGTPTIDGTVDSMWSKAESIELDYYTMGSKETNSHATCKAMWDEKNLYILAVVKDQVVVNLDAVTQYNGDCMEFWVDELNEKSTEAWDTNDGQYLVTCDGLVGVHSKKKGGGYDSRTVTAKASKNADGYVIEAVFPWVEIKGKVAVGTSIGFQLQVDDDSMATGARDGVMGWPNTGHKLPSDWGTLNLVAAPATATPKPAGNATTAPAQTDTSGNSDTSGATQDNPKTGDTGMVYLALAGLLLSSVVFAGRFIKKSVHE